MGAHHPLKEINRPFHYPAKNKPGSSRDKPVNLTEEEQELLKIHNYSEKHNLLSMHRYRQQIMEYYDGLDKSVDYSTISIPLEMRSLLIDWIISICERLSISDDALYLSIYLIDRFLIASTISSTKIQLVGVTALLIAAKYEEVLCPDIASFIMLIDHAYTDEDIKRAEKYMLHVLGYKIEYVNPLIFLRRASKANNYEMVSRKMGKYFLEIMMVYPQFLGFSKNVIGSTAMYLSRKICRTDVNRNLFNLYTNAGREEMKGCLNELTRIIYQEIKYENVENKYAKASMHEVSIKARRYAQENFN